MHIHLPGKHNTGEPGERSRDLEESGNNSLRDKAHLYGDKAHVVGDQVGAFVSKSLTDGRHKLEKSLGLGQTPSVIPPGEIDIAGEARTVEIGWHPVPGLGKWFAETGLGRSITQGVRSCPDPTQHWALIVGEYCHQLWMDEKLDVIYTNQKIKREEWQTYDVGKSRFNDEALRQAGDMTIAAMRAKRPAYNLIDNNCQTFALKLLDAIQIGKHREFATSFQVYQTAIGAGNIKALFVDHHPDEKPNQENQDVPPQGSVALAEQVMDEKTDKLTHQPPGLEKHFTV